jgi:hypothetical protein
MRVTRVLDILVLFLLGALLVMPRPSVTVKTALVLAPERRERVAELQAHLLGSPGDAAAAAELASIFLDGKRPDWALATANAELEHHPRDYRLHLLAALAYADRFEAEPAYLAAVRARDACDAAPAAGTPAAAAASVPSCGEAPHARIALLTSTLERVRGIDMRNNPALAKDKIFEGLHPVFLPKGKAAKPPTPNPPARP